MKRKLEHPEDNGKGEKKLKSTPLRALHVEYCRGAVFPKDEWIKLTWVAMRSWIGNWEANDKGEAWAHDFDPEHPSSAATTANQRQMEILDGVFNGHPVARIIQAYTPRPYGCYAWAVYSRAERMVVIRGLFLDMDEAIDEWKRWNAMHSKFANPKDVQAVMQIARIPELPID